MFRLVFTFNVKLSSPAHAVNLFKMPFMLLLHRIHVHFYCSSHVCERNLATLLLASVADQESDVEGAAVQQPGGLSLCLSLTLRLFELNNDPPRSSCERTNLSPRRTVVSMGWLAGEFCKLPASDQGDSTVDRAALFSVSSRISRVLVQCEGTLRQCATVPVL